MIFAEIRGKLALVLLVAVCLLAVPALSMPVDDNRGRSCQGPMFDLKNNLTSEELDNMTIGELKEMQNQARNDTAAGNVSACPMRGDGRNMNDGCAMSGRCKMNEMGPMGNGMRDGSNGEAAMREGPRGVGHMGDRSMGAQYGRDGEGCNGSANNGAFPGLDNNLSRCGKASQDMPGISPVMLMDDMTVADLENMTLNEIKALAQEKTQELNNMTRSEVNQLVQTRLSESDNMTLSMFKDYAKNMRQMARILEWAGSEHHFRA